MGTTSRRQALWIAAWPAPRAPREACDLEPDRTTSCTTYGCAANLRAEAARPAGVPIDRCAAMQGRCAGFGDSLDRLAGASLQQRDVQAEVSGSTTRPDLARRAA